MPFVQRVVAPVHLSRAKLHDENGVPTVRDRELDAVTNCALSNALRQMASVAALADEMFRELRGQLADVATRSAGLKCRVQALGRLVDDADPKAVTVPESDLTAFSLKTEHFKSKQVDIKNIISADNRPAWIQKLYDQAGVPSKVYADKPHVHRLSRRKRSLDDSCLLDTIELRKPAAITNLRPWTSEEVLGDITVAPDCSSRIPRDPSPISEDQIDHTLPSPEEQQQAIALKFPPQIVEVDVSGRSFNRMSALRRSLQNVEYETSVRRRKSRRPRGMRRNTIAGTDQKELEAVIGSLSDNNKDSDDVVSSSTTVVMAEKKSNLDLLKDWGRMRLKQFKSVESASSVSVKLRDKGNAGLARRKWDKDEPVHSSSGNWSASSESGQSTSTSHVPRSSVSSCSGSTKPTYHGGSSVTSDEGETGSTYSCDTEGYYTSFHVDSGLKTLREEEPPLLQPMSALHCTSALTPSSFQSSSSAAESEYDVFGRGSTSTTASSAGTVCTSLMVLPPNVPERAGSKLSCGSGSLPDRSLHAGGPPADRSAYDKCKTAPSRLTKENVTRYKDEGLMVDVEPRPSLGHCGGDSPDSGHNTCSSPVDSITSPSVDLETSECSDLEGVDRVERLRSKTAIDTSRIPSMCVITPPISDDEACMNAVALLHCRRTAAPPSAEDYGEYVTLADVMPTPAETRPCAGVGGYVHLDELPAGPLDRKKATGARVTLNAEGKVIYASDSLKRRKELHTTNTFEPGPCVSSDVIRSADNKNDVTSQVAAIPRSPLHVRPVTRQHPPTTAGQRLKPLVPVPLTYSPGQRRSVRTAFFQQQATAAATATTRVVVLPDGSRSHPGTAGKPVSPLISPTRRSLSPKEVVKGAYVRMQDPTECLETSLDEIKSAVKRSDSYRQANADSPKLRTKSPNMLMALQKARNDSTQGTPRALIDGNGDRSRRSAGGDGSTVSASTPVKNDRTSAGRIDMSTDNISPIHDYRAAGADRPRVVVRPSSGRSAMDLYAAIHESKKRLLGQQPPAVQKKTPPRPTTAAVQKKTPPRPTTTTTTTVERDRYRPHDHRSAARYDFKRLLLQTNMAGGRRAQQSAVVRLQQRPPVPVTPTPTPPSRHVTASSSSSSSSSLSSWWKSNVLSSTIQEDCREDEDCCGTETAAAAVPESAALVNRALKRLAATSSCSALETAL